MKIVTIDQMQQAERESSRFGISLDMLMENAGRSIADQTRKILGDLHQHNILVLVGPGNNGGDGLVAARHLFDWGAGRIKVYLCGKRPENDANLAEVLKRDIHCQEIDVDYDLSKFNEWLSEATTVLDAIFGTGKSRPISGIFAQVLTGLQNTKRHHPGLHLIAVDLPSGLNADTGQVDPATPSMDYTITLGFPKVGLFNLPGAEKTGKLYVTDIGIPAQLVDYVKSEIIDEKWMKTILPKRPLVSHKGTYGKILALTGSINYIGAAYLSCTGTIRTGAGLTTLAIARSLQPILAAKMTEITYLPLPESPTAQPSPDAVTLINQQLNQYDVLLVGCGLGQSPAVIEIEKKLLLENSSALPAVVLDADGINILSRFPEWHQRFQAEAILTPHAGEMARLLGKPIEEIQANRIVTAQEAAAKWNKVIVLKGAYTVIASPDGRIRVSPFANPGLASAGTGDVLAGAIAGLKAQGLSFFDAAAGGVYLHGLAGEMVKSQLGDAGMIASDLLPVLPLAIRQLKEL